MHGIGKITLFWMQPHRKQSSRLSPVNAPARFVFTSAFSRSKLGLFTCCDTGCIERRDIGSACAETQTEDLLDTKQLSATFLWPDF
jgi:hypothetical protein